MATTRERARYPVRHDAFSRTLAALLGVTLALSGCDFLDEATQCPMFEQEYQTTLSEGAVLREQIPDTTADVAMAIVLDQSALNSFFRRLSDVSLPALTESTTILGQRVEVGIQPELPLLQIAASADCAGCLSADVPFDISTSIAGVDLPRAAGVLSGQLPIALVPDGPRQTGFIAGFDLMEVTGLTLELASDEARRIQDTLQPIVTRLLSNYVQRRFAQARIATFDSWSIGRGDVLIAGRGPIIDASAGTVMIAMQTNLPLDASSAIGTRTDLPEGADVGLVFHPGLLSAMAQRMIWEGATLTSFTAQGELSATGPVHLTVESVTADDDGGLRTGLELWRTKGICGAANVSAALSLGVSPSAVSFSIGDVRIDDGRGAGALLAEADDVIREMVRGVVDTYELTVNYSDFVAGEAEERPVTDVVDARIDGRGIGVYLRVDD